MRVSSVKSMPALVDKTANVSNEDSEIIKRETAAPLNLQDFGTVSEKTIIEAIEKANKVNIGHNTRAQFSVHEVTKSIMVKIIDTETNEVLREFPPEKLLDLVAKLWDLAGILVDERR